VSELDGKTAIVTGTAHGIGAAIAAALEEMGVKFFVSDDASWITGQVISIDGGHAIF
jgi:3-oxoacyl-[acyl-carrier protein] reductase